MYETELLPVCIAMGIQPKDFWQMNPRMLKPYYEAKKIQTDELDTEMWLMGRYVYDAVSLAIGNAFRGKNKRALPYIEAPFHKQNAEREEMSEDEKMRAVKAIFNSLQIMKFNYEAEKKREMAS